LLYYMDIWYILWSFNILLHFGMLNEEKSGIPGRDLRQLHTEHTRK
jgi:hypothetical protein